MGFDGNDWNEGYSIQQTADGGFIIGGEGNNRLLFLKTDSNMVRAVYEKAIEPYWDLDENYGGS